MSVDPATAPFFGLGFVQSVASSGGTFAADPTTNCCFNESDTSLYVDSWLVRNHIVNVPEPATLALLGLGLASIIFSGRKKAH